MEISALKKDLYLELIKNDVIEPRKGIIEYLKTAKNYGGELVVASVTSEDDAKKILEESKLTPFFNHFLTEADVTKIKPNPEVYLKASRLLQTSPDRILVHEDSPPGVKAAGCPVIAFFRSF